MLSAWSNSRWIISGQSWFLLLPFSECRVNALLKQKPPMVVMKSFRFINRSSRTAALNMIMLSGIRAGSLRRVTTTRIIHCRTNKTSRRNTRTAGDHWDCAKILTPCADRNIDIILEASVDDIDWNFEGTTSEESASSAGVIHWLQDLRKMFLTKKRKVPLS